MEIGNVIRAERAKRGWDQAALAGRLGGNVRQQAVSGWERGLSRPTRKMIGTLAKVLEMEPTVLFNAAGYTNESSDSATVRPPVRPLATSLPLDELPADRFEQFSADLVQLLHRKTKVSKYGEQGHKQHGVDGVARHGKKYKATFQSKKRKQFGPEKVREAVKAVTIEADEHILLLSRVATPDAREEIKKHAQWDLWDQEDISRKVRNLPTEDARRLVDTYFPGWRESFLGIKEPGPWLTPDEFFQRFTGDLIYTHSWKLVGRAEPLENVRKFLTSKDRVAIISGRGGSGKTRLLKEVAGRASKAGFKTFFLETGGDPTPASYELLPADENLLMVIDDAHERSDVAEIVAGVLRRNEKAKILLAMRPYGFSQLAIDLRRVSIHPSELPTWKLDDLKVAEAEALAKEVMGAKADENVVKRLARLTHDCPLVTVVGAGLIKRELLNPDRLESDESVQQEILRAFRDALIADPRSGSSKIFTSLLNALAALQPVPIKSEDFTKALETLTGSPLSEILPHLRRLEDSGVLMRRGQSIRIVPDLLGDVILTEACFDQRSGISTGYLEDIHHKVAGEPLQHLLINASRVDWRISRRGIDAPSLIESLWSAIEEEFRQAGIRGRQQIIKLVQKVAYFQPERALGLAQWAIENPTNVVEKVDHPLASLSKLTYDEVLHEIPQILKLVAYTYEHLPTAADLLWELAKTDHRPLNQHPYHPMRVLGDLASYERGKPIGFNYLIFDTAARWFDDKDLSELPHSPFDVLEALMVTEGFDDSTEGLTVTWHPYGIKVEAVKTLRDKVTKRITQEIESGDLRRSVRAIKAAGDSLRYPSGLFGREVSNHEQAKWTPVFIAIMKQLARPIGKQDQDPVIGIALQRDLQWHTRFSKTATKNAARDLVSKLPKSLEHEVALALHDGWGRISFEHIEDHSKVELQKQTWFEKLAKKLTSEKSDREILDLVTERLNAHKTAFGDYGTPGPFVWALVTARSSVGEALCELAIKYPGSPLESVLAVALSNIAEREPNKVQQIASKLLAKKQLRLTQGLAQALGWNRGLRNMFNGEKELLLELAINRDEYVRNSVVRAAQLISKEHPVDAAEVLSQIPFADSAVVAREVFSTFVRDGYLKWESLSTEQSEQMWDQLRRCPSIDDYNVMEFLSEYSKNQPDKALTLLKERIERAEQSAKGYRDNEFRPIPYHWDSPLQVRGSAQLVPRLREIHGWMAKKLDSWQRQKMGTDIFWLVAGEVDQEVVDVLDEALRSGDETHLDAIVNILHDAPKTLVWDHSDFVSRALNTAAKFGKKTLQKVSGSLYATVAYGSRSGTPGEPFPEDVEQRDKSLEILSKLPPGSVEANFYDSLLKGAQQNIKRNLEEDEKLMDDREW